MNRLLSSTLLAALVSPATAADLLKPTTLPCNTKADEDEPHAASNGLVLYFVSNAKGRFELMTAKRANPMAAWGAGALVDDFTRTDTGDVAGGGFATAEGRFPQFFYFALNRGAMEKGASF